MEYFSKEQILMLLVGLLATYTVGYGIARGTVLHAVENYPEGKGGPRQDFITKKEHQPGEGWEYQLFLPAIKYEEAVTYYTRNFNR